MQQLAPDRLAGAALEQHVVGHDHRGAAVDFSSVLTCWTKLSCLFDVDAQKSSRTTTSDSRSASPSSFTYAIDDFLPNGGFVSTMSNRSPGSALQRVVDRDRAVGVLGADAVQEEVHGAEPRRGVDDLPAAQRLERRCLFWSGSSIAWLRDVVVRGEEEAAGAAGRVADPHPRLGCITSTIAWISGRGVKYWPAPVLMSSAFFSSSPS